MKSEPAILVPVTRAERSWKRLLAMLAAAPLFALGLGLIAGTAMMALWSVFGREPMSPSPGEPLLQQSLFTIIEVAVILAACALGVLLAARAVYGRPLTTWLFPGRPFSWPLLLWAFAAALPGLMMVMAFDVAVFGYEPAWPGLDTSGGVGLLTAYLAAAVLALLVAAGAEELIFRSVLLQLTAAFTRRTWLLLLVNSVVFALGHGEFDPEVLMIRALTGAAYAWAALQLGLSAALGFHLANNLAIAFVGQPIVVNEVSPDADLSDLLLEATLALWIVGAVEATRRLPRLRGRLLAAPALPQGARP